VDVAGFAPMHKSYILLACKMMDNYLQGDKLFLYGVPFTAFSRLVLKMANWSDNKPGIPRHLALCAIMTC